MTESSKAIESLKRAANYTKLAMHELGPRSYKKGQGALLKVIYKFGEDGSLEKDALKDLLNWRGREVREVAKKAEGNGYVTLRDDEGEMVATITEKGIAVMEKRMAIEDAATDAVMAGLSDEELDSLVALCDRISQNCEELGVDYDLIEKRPHRGHGHGHCHHHHHHE